MKQLYLICAVLVLLGGCIRDSESVTPSPTETTLAELPASLLENIEPHEVAFVELYDDSMPPENFADAYVTQAEINSIIDRLNIVKLLHDITSKPQHTSAPGAWCTYVITLFDGSTQTIHFDTGTVSFGGRRYNYAWDNVDKPLLKLMHLSPAQRSYHVDTDFIELTAQRLSDDVTAATFVPTLERMTERGWERIDCTGLFCGTPDPVSDSPIILKLDLSWFQDISVGTYRLSYTAYTKLSESLPFSTVFTIE